MILLRRLAWTLGVLIAASWASAEEPATPLTSIAAVRAMPLEQAAKGIPVQVDVTVTYVNVLRGELFDLFVHDGKDGIFVSTTRDLFAGRILKAGTKLRLRAVTHEGNFLPSLNCESFEILGDSPLPSPVMVRPDNLFSPGLDCQWVDVTGVLVRTDPVTDEQSVVVMELYGWTLKLMMPTSTEAHRLVQGLMQRRVNFKGVAGTVFNAQRQMTGRCFFVPSPEFIQPVDDAPPAAPTPVAGVDQLLRSDATTESWVRLRGVVTYATKSVIYMRGAGGSLRVFAGGDGEFMPGDEVEADGFAALAPFRPELRARQVKLLDRGPAPVPVSLATNTDAKKLSSLPAELIEVKAEFLGLRYNPDGVVLYCRMGKSFFDALLPDNVPAPSRLEPGSTLKLTGICELTTTYPLPRSEWVDGFRLRLRSLKDLTVLTRPSWWTPGHLLVVLALAAGVALVSAAWVWLLRRRVKEQTEVIGAQIERESVLSERRRIARDFHDTLEQELTGLAIQLDNATERFESAPGKARESLLLARKILRYSREEARTSINDLRSVLLDQGGLVAALQENLPALAAGGNAVFEFRVTGKPWRLNGPAENHLLRIAREAVANANRHANASRILAEVIFDAGTLSLVVTDDGVGFDVSAPPPRGHFGLIGLHERAAKIGAVLRIDSSPGNGTVVTVRLPAERAVPQQPDIRKAR